MSIDEGAKRAIEWGFDRWHSISGLVAVLIGVVVVAAALFAGLNLAEISTVELAIIGLIVVLICVVWFKTRIKKVARGRLGFGVAIHYDDSDQTKQLRADFVETLQDLINNAALKQRFQFIEFTQSLAKRAAADDQAAIWLLNKSNANILIYGRARVRSTDVGPSHVLDLKWAVRHAPIATEQSREFAADANSLFPRRLIFKSGDLVACEFAAHVVDAAARYVIGVAALLSAEFAYAEEMLLDSERRLVQQAQHARGTPTSVLLDRVRGKIVDNYLEWATLYMNRYSFRERKKEELVRAEPLFAKLRQYDPDNYPARLFTAMIAFLLRRDLETAKRETAACRQSTDGTWLYNEAFLVAYDGDLDSAYRSYRKAFQSSIEDGSVPTQSEEFIQGVIDEEPDRSWLYFCTGLINFRAKEDLSAARADFSRFVERVDPVRFAKHVSIAREWIIEIDGLRPH